MNEKLKKDLQLYLGKIIQQIETTFDYFEKMKLEQYKIAIELLLNLRSL